MRTLELHASTKQIKRSEGRSSVAAAAYRSGTRLEDERTGLIHDYTKKQGVEHSRIYLPDNAPEWARNRAKLWNAAEVKENRSNSCVAHELEIGFPAEFNAMQRREAGDTLCRELARRYGCAVDIAYHQPSKNGDDRNHHAHILFTTRGLDANTKDEWAAKKYRDLSSDKITVDGVKTTRGKQEVLALREFTANEINRIAKRDRLQVWTEHLSFSKRGVDREPTQHRGQTATDMLRRGKSSRIEDLNHHRQLKNSQRAMNYAHAAQEAGAMSKDSKLSQQWALRKQKDILGEAASSKLELDKQHHQQKESLEKRLSEGKTRNTIQSEINSINDRLNQGGIKKVVRVVFRQEATDKKNLINLNDAIEKVKRLENEQRQKLEDRQQKEREEQKQKQEVKKTPSKSRSQNQGTQSRSDSDTRTQSRRKTDKPKPTPPPPREALSIAQQWGEKSGQNAKHIKDSVQARKIDTNKLAMPKEDKSKEFDRRKPQEDTTAKQDIAKSWAEKKAELTNDNMKPSKPSQDLNLEPPRPKR